MKKILLIVLISLFSCFFLRQSAAFAKNNKSFYDYETSIIYESKNVYSTTCRYIKKGLKKGKLYHCCTNNPTLTEMIPNPVVYWYGTSTSDEPILLFNFKAGIPLRCLVGRLVVDLDAIILKLKIPEQHDYFFKILTIHAEPIVQMIDYQSERTTTATLKPSYQGAEAGSISRIYRKAMNYNAERPVVNFYGASSDTLTIMLKRGKDYPIPHCQYEVSMLVRAIKQNPRSCKTAAEFYDDTKNPSKEKSKCKWQDLKFKKSIVQVVRNDRFTNKLPLIAKLVVVPIVKLFYPRSYDVRVIKPDYDNMYTTSRVMKGTHIDGCCYPDSNSIVDLKNERIRDDDILYKEMELPYKIEECKKKPKEHTLKIECNE